MCYFSKTATYQKMTKNTTGGKGHKKQSSKAANFVQRDYKINSSMEVEGYVDKILGNGMIRVNSTNGKHVGLICTIRGKFKGRYKANNKIETNGIVIVGLREWESPFKTADLLFVSNGKHKSDNDDGIDFQLNTHTRDDRLDFQPNHQHNDEHFDEHIDQHFDDEHNDDEHLHDEHNDINFDDI